MSTGRDDDKTWAELVDAFNAEPGPDDEPQRWPAAENVDPETSSPLDDLPDPYHTASQSLGEVPGPALTGGHHPGDPPRSDADVPGASDGQGDDHFVPPIPPPIPRGDRVSQWAWAGLITAPSVLLLSTITRWSPPDGLMVVLIGGFIAGFGTLVSRMRGRNPHDPDNGAVV